MSENESDNDGSSSEEVTEPILGGETITNSKDTDSEPSKEESE